LSGNLPKRSEILALTGGCAGVDPWETSLWSLRAATKITPAKVVNKQTVPIKNTARFKREKGGVSVFITLGSETISVSERFEYRRSGRRSSFSAGQAGR